MNESSPEITRLADWLTHYATCFIDDERVGRRMLEIVAALRAPAQGQQEPVAWINGDELANMLDDRSVVISGKRDGWRNTPLYASAQCAPEAKLRAALIEIVDAVDDMRLVNRLQEIERIAIAALATREARHGRAMRG